MVAGYRPAVSKCDYVGMQPADEPTARRSDVKREEVIMLDADNVPTDDPKKARRGSVETEYDDGTILSTSFTA